MRLPELVSKYGVYLSVFAAVVCAVVQAAGVMIPEWVYGAEGTLGLTAIRTTVSVNGAGPGWKTYTIALMTGVVTLVQAAQTVMLLPFAVPDTVYDAIYTVLAGSGLGTLRVAVRKFG